MKATILCLLAGAMLALLPVPAGAGLLPSRGEPRFRVTGMDIRTNRRMRHTLEIVAEDDRRTDFFDASFLEDSALILLQYMERQGYLQPRVDIRAVTDAGDTHRFRWDADDPPQLPRALSIRRVRFRMVPGRIYYYDRLTLPGFVEADRETIMTAEAVRRYFYPSGFLVRRRRMRAFTESQFRRSAENLRESLRRQGFRDADVATRVVERDDETGAVHAAVEISPGPRYRVRDLILLETPADPAAAVTGSVERVMAPWSRIWEQDTTVRLSNALLERGFADASCTLTAVAVESDDDVAPGERLIDVEAMLVSGAYIETGAIRFEGRAHTHERVMRRRLMLAPGEPLNPLLVERSRRRLAAMGSFERVSVDYSEVEPEPRPPEAEAPVVRDIVFRVEEGRRLEVSLLAGYGSYELLRGGLEIEQRNLWGRGHRARSLLVQSFKSTEADIVYTVPELLADRLSGFSRISMLRRTELDFERREIGASAGVRRYLPVIDSDVSLRYAYELLRSQRFEGARDIGRTDAAVGSLAADIRHDRRDNPIYPRRGGQANTRVEVAAKLLGGEAEFLTWEIGGSLHVPVGSGRVWHIGVNNGVVKALGDQRAKLPFNRRFFPGGDRSQRGYRHGEAASLNADNQLIGSEAYFLFQNEIEQALTPVISLLLFCDSLHIGEDLERWPEGEWLISAGVGVRYRTIVGPVRAEYGHNLRRRDADPHGMLHISVGFPF